MSGRDSRGLRRRGPPCAHTGAGLLWSPTTQQGLHAGGRWGSQQACGVSTHVGSGPCLGLGLAQRQPLGVGTASTGTAPRGHSPTNASCGAALPRWRPPQPRGDLLLSTPDPLAGVDLWSCPYRRSFPHQGVQILPVWGAEASPTHGLSAAVLGSPASCEDLDGEVRPAGLTATLSPTCLPVSPSQAGGGLRRSHHGKSLHGPGGAGAGSPLTPWSVSHGEVTGPCPNVMAPARTAVLGGSSGTVLRSITFSWSAHKMGSMAPGVLATTFRISASETQKRSLRKTFL